MLLPQDPYLSTPAGSIAIMTDEAREGAYIEKLHGLPPQSFELATSMKTGAFIRGVVKQFNIPVERSPFVAFAVLQILVKERSLAGLAPTLSSTANFPQQISQQVAREIERELFSLIGSELSQSSNTQQRNPQVNLNNVLDLKQAPPKPPEVPR
ncbi:MAG: hypothetical protein WD200_00980 [Candidatus Andersenbacteria bacterium]